MAHGYELGLRLRLCSARHVGTVGPSVAGSPSFLAQELRSLRFLCCCPSLSLCQSCTSCFGMHCVGLRFLICLACVMVAHGHNSARCVFVGFSSTVFFSLSPYEQLRVGLLVLVTLATLARLGVARYSTSLRRAFVRTVPHFLMDSLSGWSVPSFLMDSLSGWCFVRLDLHGSLGADGFSHSLRVCYGCCLHEAFSFLLASSSRCCNNACLVCKATASASST